MNKRRTSVVYGVIGGMASSCCWMLIDAMTLNKDPISFRILVPLLSFITGFSVCTFLWKRIMNRGVRGPLNALLTGFLSCLLYHILFSLVLIIYIEPLPVQRFIEHWISTFFGSLFIGIVTFPLGMVITILYYLAVGRTLSGGQAATDSKDNNEPHSGL